MTVAFYTILGFKILVDVSRTITRPQRLRVKEHFKLLSQFPIPDDDNFIKNLLPFELSICNDELTDITQLDFDSMMSYYLFIWKDNGFLKHIMNNL